MSQPHRSCGCDCHQPQHPRPFVPPPPPVTEGGTAKRRSVMAALAMTAAVMFGASICAFIVHEAAKAHSLHKITAIAAVALAVCAVVFIMSVATAGALAIAKDIDK